VLMPKRIVSRLVRGLQGSAAMMALTHGAMRGWIKNFLMRKLNSSPNLKGGFAVLELHWLQGLVVLRKVYLTRLADNQPVVELCCEEIRVHVEWRPLLHGTLVGRVDLRQPHLQIVASRSQARSNPNRSPGDALLALCRETRRFMPFHLRSAEVHDGRVEYLSQNTSPPFTLNLERLTVHASNLTNILEVAAEDSAQVFVTSRTTGEGQLWLRLTIPSMSDGLTFQLHTELKEINLVALNDLLRALAKFDLRRGRCSMTAEFNVERGHYEGVVQPHFHDLDVFAWQKEHGKGLLQILRQVVIAFLAVGFKNQARDELAMRIPVSGTFIGQDVDTWAAVGSLLRNVFTQSLLSKPESPEPAGRLRP
jgi:hypothetical protein